MTDILHIGGKTTGKCERGVTIDGGKRMQAVTDAAYIGGEMIGKCERRGTLWRETAGIATDTAHNG